MKSGAIKISIIIPIYNMEQYLRECLNSITSQSLKEIEIICINDGSFDKSQEILSEYSWKDKRFRVVEQINSGAASARNSGITIASGEYVCFMDPDDYYPDDNTLLDLYESAIKNKALICGGSFREDNKDYTITQWSGNLSKYAFEKDGYVSYADYQFEYGFHRFLYQRNFLINNNLYFPDLKFFEDPVFFVKVMSTAGEFYALKRISYCYRTGHKVIEWNLNQVIDLLKGIKYNIIFAKEKKYLELLSLERARLENDYMEPILQYFVLRGNEKVYQLLDEINKALFQNGERVEYHIFNRKLKGLEYDAYIERQRNTEEKEKFKQQIQLKVAEQIKLEHENETIKSKFEQEKLKYEDFLKKKSFENIELEKKLKHAQEKTQNLNYKLKDVEEEKKQLKENLQEKNFEILNLQEKLKRDEDIFYNSTTWKVGNIILTIPKHIKKLFRGKTRDE